MSTIISILNIASPLLLITLGALVSEYTGRLAMFMESIINTGAFLCYAFTVFTHSAFTGSILSVSVCMLFVLGLFPSEVSHYIIENLNFKPLDSC